MSVSNKRSLGLNKFIKEFYTDLNKGVATGWWGEQFGRKSDSIWVDWLDNKFAKTYDLISYIKDNHSTITQDNIDAICFVIASSHYMLTRKRSYLWEVNAESQLVVTEDLKIDEDNLPDDCEIIIGEGELAEEAFDRVEAEEVEVLEDTVEEDLINKPDWDLAKSFLGNGTEAEAKVALIEYAKNYDIDLSIFDKRKAFPKFLASFKSRWIASQKAKNK